MNARRYPVRFQSPAKRALSHTLPAAVAAAAFEFCVGALADNPHRVGGRLREPLEGYYSARRGTYRVVYVIHDPDELVAVEWIGHRLDVYRRR